MIYQLHLLLKRALILRLSNVSSLFYLQFVQCLRKMNQHLRGLVLVLWTACASSGAVRWWFFLCWPVGAGVIRGGCWWLPFAVSDALVSDGTKITEKSLDLDWAMTAIRLTSKEKNLEQGWVLAWHILSWKQDWRRYWCFTERECCRVLWKIEMKEANRSTATLPEDLFICWH